ncbi:unnamed protein product [Acanthoscelides obtectus]|uniref:Uncharacterized protein n=1 Tax=Acanthoscelides obtectus TaxID=200917 RepID=A0A9P0JPM0_ACAOB|nr:unnamed protein product [Acanthoscelides obtectus]CAK1678809.1 hypothetical protein AOBTE_LOCUS32027 [Acanthoscelides obtectus]
MHHHHGHRGRYVLGGHRDHHHGKMGKFGRRDGCGHNRRGHPMLDGGCPKGKMTMKFGRHHGACMQGDEFHRQMDKGKFMMKFGKGHHQDMMKWKCKMGKQHHKGKGTIEEFFRMMMEYLEETDAESGNDCANEINNQEDTQGQGSNVQTDQEAAEIQEESPDADEMMRFGRCHGSRCHGPHEGKLKMKFGKKHGGHHKDKMGWKCKRDRFEHHAGEGCSPIRAFIDMMCSDGRRRELWKKFARMMMENESETEPEGKNDEANQRTDQTTVQETGQTSNMDTDTIGNAEGNQDHPQTSETAESVKKSAIWIRQVSGRAYYDISGEV